LPLIVVIAGVWMGAMLLFAGVMVAMGAVARRADEQDARGQGAAPAASLAAPSLDGEIALAGAGRPVLAACRECLSVVAGSHERCPACGGPLTPTHSLDAPTRDPAAVPRAL
jgi:hypothetical protein